VERPAVAVSDVPGVLPDDLMGEAGRKVLAFHLARMLHHEPSVREGSDPKDVHDMRVAIRRMRSAIPTFAPYFEEKTLKQAQKTLRTLGRALGPVRDLDVLALKTQKYAERHADHPDQHRKLRGLDGLLSAWRHEQQVARSEFIDLMDSEVVERFLLKFAHFLDTPEKNALLLRLEPESLGPRPLLVRHVAPRVLYEKYETVRAYQPFLDALSYDGLHALRIRAKELRYALEAFSEVLNADAAAQVITAIKQLQDYLGDMQDARVAASLVEVYLKRTPSKDHTPAVLQYLAVRQAEQSRLRGGVNAAWQAFDAPDVRRALAASVAEL
jgi:CHAD domain-containing protein